LAINRRRIQRILEDEIENEDEHNLVAAPPPLGNLWINYSAVVSQSAIHIPQLIVF
jgi:hypothetical protein